MPLVRTRRTAALPLPLLVIATGVSPVGGRYRPEEDIAAALLQDTITLASQPCIGAEVRVALDGDGDSVPPPAVVLPPGSWFAQRGHTPGERFFALFEDCLGTQETARPVCIIGTDTPHLPVACLQEAFGRLQRPDVEIVLGPAGGGYYLIGLKEPRPALFAQIPWNTPAAVLTETLERAAESGGRVARLPAWYAIDAPEALDPMRRDVERGVVVAPETHTALRRRRTTD